MTAIGVIANTASGKGKDQVARLKQALSRHPGQFDLRSVPAGGSLAETVAHALEEGFTTLVAAGGDGTINAVASKLAGTECRLGVVPMGTFNYFARSLDIPLEIDDAVDALLDGRDRMVGVGEVNGITFLNNASLGACPAILRERERIYERWGRSRMAAFWSVLKTLLDFRRPVDLTITADGETHVLRTPSVFIASNAYQLEAFSEEGADIIRQGRLVLLAAPNERRYTLLRHTVLVGLGRGERNRDFTLIAGRGIDIETARSRTLLARDGERGVTKGPLRFRYRPDALRVIVPQEGIG